MTVSYFSTINDPQKIENVYEYLDTTLNTESTPLNERFRALFTLKSLGTKEAIDIIGKGFKDSSALLKHELAYVLGQMKNKDAVDILSGVLLDLNQEPMVRHEAAEALGAIGQKSCIPLLKQFVNDSSSEVAETCELAIASILHEKLPGENDSNPYCSIDPAPALEQDLSVEILGEMLMNTKLPLFERYRAMFELRNRGSEEAVHALAQGLINDSSALFRHEVAYVFGQLQHPASIPYLAKCLENVHDYGIVRHECAEALGSIATLECENILKKFINDDERVVRESCIVALDMLEHEKSGEFQYANGISKVLQE